MFPEVGRLADEVRLSFHAFSEFARQAHGGTIDPPGRAVLEYLSKNPPGSVPTIARSRGVSRQHIQTIVNALQRDGLVEALENPGHKRSPLYAPTDSGRALMQSVSETERELVEARFAGLDPARLMAAAETLAEVRTLLDGVEDAP